VLYDRHHKRKAQQRWCNLVSPLAQEPLPTNLMPRRVTIILAGPPGDSVRVAREHFHEYIKPILVAGAVDWEVIEGRREGEVRAGLAEKIRKLRRRDGEFSTAEPVRNNEEDALEQARQNGGIKDWDGVQGDLILGRHTWKEYIRGLHEGWLGPLDPPTRNTPENSKGTTPHILPTEYPTAAIPSSIPPSLTPTVVLPLPHLLGFLSTPTRLYRFLNRRHLADTTGASIAALVLATTARPYTSTAAPPSTENDNRPSPPFSSVISEPRRRWEQEDVLRGEEAEWHKSAWTDEKDAEKERQRERVWREDIIIDDRIGERMRVFELQEGDRERALREEEKMAARKNDWLGDLKTWLGIEQDKSVKGWEMGLVGNEDD
jgi:import inner membrane translocase subunit TIM54